MSLSLPFYHEENHYGFFYSSVQLHLTTGQRKIKDHQAIFTEDEITDLIDELVTEAGGLIKDKAQTYDVAFKDTDMVKKTILILFEECYLAFDEKGVLNG